MCNAEGWFGRLTSHPQLAFFHFFFFSFFFFSSKPKETNRYFFFHSFIHFFSSFLSFRFHSSIVRYNSSLFFFFIRQLFPISITHSSSTQMDSASNLLLRMKQLKSHSHTTTTTTTTTTTAATAATTTNSTIHPYEDPEVAADPPLRVLPHNTFPTLATEAKTQPARTGLREVDINVSVNMAAAQKGKEGKEGKQKTQVGEHCLNFRKSTAAVTFSFSFSFLFFLFFFSFLSFQATFAYPSREQEWDHRLGNQPDLARHKLFEDINRTKNSAAAWLALVEHELACHISPEKRLWILFKAIEDAESTQENDGYFVTLWLMYAKAQQ